MSAHGSRERVRSLAIGYGAQTITIIVFMTYWLLYVRAPHVYLSLLRALEPAVWSYPFLDLEAVLRAVDCARRGVDVTLPNACMGGGLFQYSPFLLQAASLPLEASQRVPLGLALDGLFLLSFFALPRPRRWSEFWALLLAGLSTSVLFAVERANIDVLLYLLSFGAALLLLRGGVARAAGYGFILAGAAVKFYPASLMALALRESSGRFIALALFSLLAALLLVFGYHSELGHVLAHLPQGSRSADGVPFANTFSAGRLPEGIAWFVTHGHPEERAGSALRILLQAFLMIYVIFRASNCVPLLLPGVRNLPEKECILLVAGSLVTVLCFFLANNIYYRQIFLVPTIPGWLALQRAATNATLRNCARLTSWAIVVILWAGFFRYGARAPLYDTFGLAVAMSFYFIVWFVYECLWWWLLGTMVAVIVCFVWDSRTVARLRVVLAAAPRGDGDPEERFSERGTKSQSGALSELEIGASPRSRPSSPAEPR